MSRPVLLPQAIRPDRPLPGTQCVELGGETMGTTWSVKVSTPSAAFDARTVQQALEARLHEAGVRYEGHRYLAHHGFANETAQGPGRIAMTQYDAAWAQQAWDRTLRFFGATLA